MTKTATISINEFFEKSYKKLQLTKERKYLLQSMAMAISAELTKSKFANLNFICTHNSRRSQLGQVWAHIAAEQFNLNISSFSGGTEITAFHRNTVKKLQKVGFSFKVKEFSHQNPVYSITHENSNSPIIGFSKIYDDPQNLKPFIAITTCNSADQNCPYIPEAKFRFHLPFVDPKYSDQTAEQDEIYLQTNRQIAGEVYFLFKEIKQLLA